MGKINDPVLAEAALQLRNEKMAFVARLNESVSLTIDAQLFRRRLVVVRETVTPSGAAGSIAAQYRSPTNEGIEWFGMSVNSANILFLAFLGSAIESAAGAGAVRYTSLRCPAGLSVNLIGAIAGPISSSTNDYKAESIYVAPGNLLTVELEPVGVFDANQINYTIMGWTSPAPRTKTEADVLASVKAIVVP